MFSITSPWHELYKTYFHHAMIFFQLTVFSLHETTKDFLAFTKTIVNVFTISLSIHHATLIDLAIFWKWRNLIGLFEFDIALSEILLIAFINYFNVNLNKLYSACAKQNATERL